MLLHVIISTDVSATCGALRLRQWCHFDDVFKAWRHFDDVISMTKLEIDVISMTSLKNDVISMTSLEIDVIEKIVKEWRHFDDVVKEWRHFDNIVIDRRHFDDVVRNGGCGAVAFLDLHFRLISAYSSPDWLTVLSIVRRRVGPADLDKTSLKRFRISSVCRRLQNWRNLISTRQKQNRFPRRLTLNLTRGRLVPSSPIRLGRRWLTRIPCLLSVKCVALPPGCGQLDAGQDSMARWIYFLN